MPRLPAVRARYPEAKDCGGCLNVIPSSTCLRCAIVLHQRGSEMDASSLIDWIPAHMRHNMLSMALCFAIVLTEVKLFSFLRSRSYLSTPVTRKLVHMLTGTIFLATWTFFDATYNARFYAAIVPATVTVQFFAVGIGILPDPDTVRLVSRTGDRKELLKGPVSYGVVISLATILWWRQTPAIISILALCIGDGVAGLLGPFYGKHKLSWNKTKSWEGSILFFVCSVATILPFVHLFASLGWIPLPSSYNPIVLTLAACTFVESLPISEWDNVTVFATALLLSLFI